MNPARRRAWLAWMLATCSLIADAGAAQAVYKCRDAQRVVRYQDASCPPRQHTEWVREADTTRPPAPITQSPKTHATPARSTTARRTRAASGVRGAVISLHRDAAACARAKKARDQTYARLGLRRDFATSRRLDDRVYTACR